MENISRRQVLATTGAAVSAGVAGCAGTLGSGESSGETFGVGYGDYQTTVKAADFPKKLYVYAVQSGWSNWPAIMQAFEEQYGVPLNDDDRSSGEALKDLRSHAQNPTHSAYNGGYTYGILAMNDGLTQAYKPANWDAVPKKLKTDNGHMTATRRMTTAVTYRKDLYEERGLDAPETWDDLLQPEITKDLALQTPTAAVGLAAALSVNNARGGSLDDLQPVIDYYKQIKDGGAEFTDNFLAQFTKGEYATFIRYDYSGLNLKYNNDEIAEENVGVALLKGKNGNKGAFNQPYGYGMLKDAPNPGACKLFMDYVLSLEGQRKFLDAYVRPIRAPELEMPDEFPDQSTYDETEFQVDYGSLVEKQERIIQQINREANL
ncbi:extracellular solute-binding protein (plasmid) [Haloferax mediterranei ATCC 33500]|uniref:ABC-type transport system periplasmic substrate-binding protein n=1 Tax=Haloferax mediterranei (strain ATCC 33500 / DSM 1411 / JCM 8866 / NBRC 14739 / NCIMB 2177 / R-4) TaxID=523841 RepID=I3RAE7_HALMT|nr:extracellular solute-binding protein [Haloferax mediterranei]AFK21207.1 ABC-type transport system periplasmic substrate-binding protein [Haloferax mediterranei ATCC 33500]AHZ24683.1 sulfate ABC transporter substrate-binding protein [Haloferax mediterranei ATCC 33500]ELZ97459.1 ABC-type transport system periplasmic substrate-binding protein [Haloferax mediterranei ATCC 33500]MDX5990250.1 extracellular solute-binding protein [Haloferax mediterranei ATCC 33500]QCQ76683.1 extracellular solute-b